MKEVYKAKIIKKTSDGKIPLEVALMQQVRMARRMMNLEKYHQAKIILLFWFATNNVLTSLRTVKSIYEFILF